MAGLGHIPDLSSCRGFPFRVWGRLAFVRRIARQHHHPCSRRTHCRPKTVPGLRRSRRVDGCRKLGVRGPQRSRWHLVCRPRSAGVRDRLGLAGIDDVHCGECQHRDTSGLFGDHPGRCLPRRRCRPPGVGMADRQRLPNCQLDNSRCLPRHRFSCHPRRGPCYSTEMSSRVT